MHADAQGVGDRIEHLLESLRPGKDKEIAEELVRLLVEMYGEGLARITGMITEMYTDDSDLMDRLVKDDLVESLLLLHDLHPVDVGTRIQRALDGVRPFLGSHAGGVEFLGVDDEGIAQLSLQGSCEGCPSSTLTVKMAIETAIMQAAPDINGIEVAGVQSDEPGLLQVRMGPPPDWHAPGVVCPATKAEVP